MQFRDMTSQRQQYLSDTAAFVITVYRFRRGNQQRGKLHAARQYLLFNFYVP
jgi:hypothetical protein